MRPTRAQLMLRLALVIALCIPLIASAFHFEDQIDDLMSGWLLWSFPHAIGALLFCFYVPMAVRGLSMERSPRCTGVVVFALVYAIWGPVIAMACGGMLGLMQTVVAMAVLSWIAQINRVDRRVVVVLAPAASLVGAFAISAAIFSVVTPGSFDVFSSAFAMTLVVGWNGCMAAMLLSLAAIVDLRWIDSGEVRCASCGYPVVGLPGPDCPECGTPIPMALS